MNRALWHISESASELREEPSTAPPGLVAVQSAYSMISTGTERLVALGRAANPGAGLDAPYAAGDYGFPIKYGYSLVGHDEHGDLVHCLHPHQAIAFVHESDLARIPDSVTPQKAALLSNMETVLNATWDANSDFKVPVLICGFGNIGALLALTLRLRHGVEPVIAETGEWRRARAAVLGFDARSPEHVDNLFAVAIHTSASSEGLQFCIDRAAPDATVVELSWYGLETTTLRLGGAFHRNRVRLVSSQVATIPPVVRDTVSINDRKAMAMELLSDPAFDALISNELSFDETPDWFARLRRGQIDNGLVWLIRY